jgi:hypothetical protein
MLRTQHGNAPLKPQETICGHQHIAIEMGGHTSLQQRSCAAERTQSKSESCDERINKPAVLSLPSPLPPLLSKQSHGGEGSMLFKACDLCSACKVDSGK